jgi:pimeloyl-ACP methyl ester carboxylesterase
MATYVLVHGGGHGGWCYQPVARLLRGEGHEVYAPTLTGLADRRHLLGPDVDLETHISDIANLIAFEGLTDVILVGHSYGGMVITGAADRAGERIGQLVYLDAAIPFDGEALADVSPGLLSVRPTNRIVHGVELTLWPDPDIIAMYGLDDPELAAWAVPKLTPHPWKTVVQPLRLRHPNAVAAKPRTIINCTSTMERRRETVSADHFERWHSADRVWEIDTGHDLMLTRPRETADMLLKLAKYGVGDR